MLNERPEAHEGCGRAHAANDWTARGKKREVGCLRERRARMSWPGFEGRAAARGKTIDGCAHDSLCGACHRNRYQPTGQGRFAGVSQPAARGRRQPTRRSGRRESRRNARAARSCANRSTTTQPDSAANPETPLSEPTDRYRTARSQLGFQTWI